MTSLPPLCGSTTRNSKHASFSSKGAEEAVMIAQPLCCAAAEVVVDEIQQQETT